MLTDLVAEAQQLARPAGPRGIVEIDDFPAFLQGKAQALAAQGKAQAGAVAVGISARAAPAGRGQEPLVLVETQRPRGDAEFPGQLLDGINPVQWPAP